MMKCPKCKEAMGGLVVGEVVVDRCGRCFGLWLNDGEFERLRALKDSDLLNLEIPEGTVVEDRAVVLRCTRCHCRLETKRSAVSYEFCPKCRGSFLDAGEFKRMAHATPFDRVLGFLGFSRG